MFRLLSYFLLLFVFGMFMGCQPRGETRTLDSIYSQARLEFEKVSHDLQDVPVGKEIKQTAEMLKLLVSDVNASDLQVRLQGVAEDLANLRPLASYTNRPAFGELQQQFFALSQQAGEKMPTKAQLKLLAARTYSLISAELATTHFHL